MRDLNVKNESKQILEKNMGEFLFNLGVGKGFLIMA